MSTTGLILSKTLAIRPQQLSRAIRKVALRATAAAAASLLIFGRSFHEKNCAKIHASMILHSFLHG